MNRTGYRSRKCRINPNGGKKKGDDGGTNSTLRVKEQPLCLTVYGS